MTGVFHLLLPRAALANLSALEVEEEMRGRNECSLAAFISSRHSWFPVLPKQPVLKINRYCTGAGF